MASVVECDRRSDTTPVTSLVTTSLPFIGARTVAVPVDFFAALRKLVESPSNPVSVDSIRDAGYHAGQALFEAFTAWLASHGESTPESLDDANFPRLASQFFEEMGWGSMDISNLSDAVVAIDAHDWAEGDAEGSGCHVSTGLLAGFFGRLAEAPIAVLEVECRGIDDPRCRFLLGSVDVLAYVHEAMGRGIPYERAAASA